MVTGVAKVGPMSRRNSFKRAVNDMPNTSTIDFSFGDSQGWNKSGPSKIPGVTLMPRETPKNNRDFDARDYKPDKPDKPILSYKFGDSQGWNKPAPSEIPGVTLMPPESSEKGWDLGLLGNAVHAYRDLDNFGAIGAITATAALFAIPIIAPAGGVLGAISIMATAGAATYSWTNLAVHLAGGGDSFEFSSGMFNPYGIVLGSSLILGGAETDTAFKGAKIASQAYDTIDDLGPLKRLNTLAEAGALAVKLDSLRQNLQELGMLSGDAPVKPGSGLGDVGSKGSIQHPQCTIRKPGGPFKLLRP